MSVSVSPAVLQPDHRLSAIGFIYVFCSARATYSSCDFHDHAANDYAESKSLSRTATTIVHSGEMENNTDSSWQCQTGRTVLENLQETITNTSTPTPPTPTPLSSTPPSSPLPPPTPNTIYYQQNQTPTPRSPTPPPSTHYHNQTQTTRTKPALTMYVV